MTEATGKNTGLNKFLYRLDKAPLWLLGFVLLIVTFLPYFILKEGSVFEIHDQMDETLLTYVLNAKYLGTGVKIFPELLGGVNASGMQPSAILFIPLYRLFPPLIAFLIQYAVVCASGFFGMYFSVKEITGSSILSLVTAGCFCLLPVQPIYGLSILGVPLLLYVFLCLYQRKKKCLSFGCILLFGLTTHLVLIGYVVLGFWALALLVQLIQKKKNKWLILGFVFLTGIYIGVNHSLFSELLLGNSSYVSHRAELVNYGMPVWDNIKELFLESAQHAPSLHKYLILPIVLLLLAEGIALLWKKHRGESIADDWKMYLAASLGFALLAAIAVFYGICKSEAAAQWKNSMSGFLRYFQAERFYWFYPAGWYLELALVFGVWWKKGRSALWCKMLVLAVIMLPTVNLIKVSSYFYMNVNQINNGSGITGYVSWESYYAEDLMQEVETAIGREPDTYKVAHLGISPAPSLMHGFYTVDGYSNNYPLDYKHRFRQVIAKEIAQNEETRLYFDEWGSRCYLFNSVTGTYYNMPKGSGIQYDNLNFDMKALKDLGCEYLFSGGEILHPEEMGLTFMGYFETESSYWGIWLYALS